MTTLNTLEFYIFNEKIRKFLIEEGVIDPKTITYTKDSFEDFVLNCEDYSDSKKLDYDGQKIEILENYQFKKGDVRKTLFYFEDNNDGQNLVIIY